MNASGNGHQHVIHFTTSPRRVVSLVPSMTESIFDLGFGNSLVGITEYCIYPEGKLLHLPRVGGPKNPDINKILSLNPDLVITNQEENPESLVEELERAGIRVWVTFPKTVRQAVDLLWVLVGIYQDHSAALRLETLEVTLDWAESALSEHEPWQYFCPIWFESTQNVEPWWMTFNHDTYMNDVLRLMGGVNVFSSRIRKYPIEADLGLMDAEDPGKRDVRYPRLANAEILSADPQVILLPNEPYKFGTKELRLVQETFNTTSAVKEEKVVLVEGSLLSWHGTRLARALVDLPVMLGSL